MAGAQCNGVDIAKRAEIPTDSGWDGDAAASIYGAPRAKWHFQFGSECTDLSLAYLNLKDDGCQDLAHALTSEMAMQVEVINLRYNDIGPGSMPPYHLLKRELNPLGAYVEGDRGIQTKMDEFHHLLNHQSILFALFSSGH